MFIPETQQSLEAKAWGHLEHTNGPPLPENIKYEH